MRDATLTKDTAAAISVGMGQIAMIRRGEIARAVLGSCIGVAIYNPGRAIAAVAHVVLAESQGNTSALPGKFADQAIPAMLEMLAREGVGRADLVAKIAGGANMFGGNGPIQIGRNNHAAVRELLGRQRIPIVAEDVGGDKGRRVSFDTELCQLVVEFAGLEPIVL